MTKIWKEIKFISKKKTGAINELLTENGKTITNDNEILDHMIKDIEENFYNKDIHLKENFTNTINNADNYLDTIDNDQYNRSTIKEGNQHSGVI